MIWRNISPLANMEKIEQYEVMFGYELPLGFKECMLRNNGGIPSRNHFRTRDGFSHEIDTFLSFLYDDENTIWPVVKLNKMIAKYIPFARDISGNLLCFDREDSSVVLWSLKRKSCEVIAVSWGEFICSLR